MKKGIFIAAPMNSITPHYTSFRKDIIRLIECLEEIFQCEVHFGGKDKSSSEDFGFPPVSFKQNMSKLDEYDKFILIYPEKLASSVLVETGWALKAEKECIFFVKNRDELPFLLQNFEQGKVRIIDYKVIDEIIKLFEKHKKDMFKV